MRDLRFLEFALGFTLSSGRPITLALGYRLRSVRLAPLHPGQGANHQHEQRRCDRSESHAALETKLPLLRGALEAQLDEIPIGVGQIFGPLR